MAETLYNEINKQQENKALFVNRDDSVSLSMQAEKQWPGNFQNYNSILVNEWLHQIKKINMFAIFL
jgi:hypothetical protein